MSRLCDTPQRQSSRRTDTSLPLCDDSYRNRPPKSRQTALGTFRWHLDTWEVFVMRAELGRTAMRTIHTCAASGCILIEMPKQTPDLVWRTLTKAEGAH